MPRIFINGKMQEVSSEEAANLQQKAQQQGMQQTPISPAAAAGVGATEKQADMAGTKTQKDAALKIQPMRGLELGSQERLAGARTEATAEESALLRKQQRLSSLGSLGSRVDQLIENQFAQTATTEPVTYAVKQEMLVGLDEETKASVEQTVLDYQTAINNEDPAAADTALVALKELLGDALTTPEQVSEYLQGVKESVGTDIANRITNEITLEQIDPTELDMSEEDMLEFFGEDWKSLTVPDMKAKIEELRKAEFTRMDSLQQELGDSSTSSVRRAEIMSQMRDMGGLGIATAEAEMTNIERSIEDADSVQFGDSGILTISELLDDDNVSGMIERFLGLPDESEAKKQLAEDFGSDFVNWIDTHATALKGLSENIETTADAFNELQQSNKDAERIEGVGQISENIMRGLYGEQYGEWSDKDYAADLAGQEWHKILTAPHGGGGVTATNKANFLKVLDEVDLGPELATELKELSESDARSLMNDPQKFRDYTRYRSQFKSLNELSSDELGDTEFLLDYMFGEDTSYSEITEAIKRNKIAGKIDSASRDKSDMYSELLDEDGDITASSILDYMQNSGQSKVSGKAASMQEYLDGVKTEGRFSEVDGLQDGYSSKLFNTLYDKGFLKNGKIDKQEMNDILRDEGLVTRLYNDPNMSKFISPAAELRINTWAKDKAEILLGSNYEAIGLKSWKALTNYKNRWKNKSGAEILKTKGRILLPEGEAKNAASTAKDIRNRIKREKIQEPIRSAMIRKAKDLEGVVRAQNQSIKAAKKKFAKASGFYDKNMHQKTTTSDKWYSYSDFYKGNINKWLKKYGKKTNPKLYKKLFRGDYKR